MKGTKLISFILATLTTLAISAQTFTFKGQTAEGKSCEVNLKTVEENGRNVVAIAQVTGRGIPYLLGNFTTKNKVFEMVELTSTKDTLVSLQSEFDPSLRITLGEDNGSTAIEFFELYIGGLSPKKIICE